MKRIVRYKVTQVNTRAKTVVFEQVTVEVAADDERDPRVINQDPLQLRLEVVEVSAQGCVRVTGRPVERADNQLAVLVEF